MAEMVTYLPISSPFIRFAGRYVDEAFGVAAGYNFFVFEAALVPFEIVACTVIINYWSNAVPPGGIIAIVIFLYRHVPSFAHALGSITGFTMIPSSRRFFSKFDQRFRCQVVWRVRVLAGSWQSHSDRRTDHLYLHHYVGR